MTEEEYQKILRNLQQYDNPVEKIKYLENVIEASDFDANGCNDELIRIFNDLKINKDSHK